MKRWGEKGGVRLEMVRISQRLWVLVQERWGGRHESVKEDTTED